MPPQIAAIVFSVGIAGLFWLDRDASVRPSRALWLAIIWLAEAGSRSLSVWLDMGAAKEIAGQIPATSPLDQIFASALMFVGAVVLFRRRSLVTKVIKAGWPIALYFSFCLVSLLWSDYAGWGLKRWVRSLGDLIMLLIVVTDADPSAALRRLLSRVGFVLLPTSVLLINYYPQLGTGYDPWGLKEFTGVTTNKNVLGNLVYVMLLGALWQVLSLIRDKHQPNRTRHLLAQGTLIAFGFKLLNTAHCATAVACFALGTGLMLITSVPFIRHRPARVHAVILTIIIGGGLFSLLGGRAAITEALGRKPDLTGRTEIWKNLIPMAPNPIGGAGFETFWVGPRVKKIFAVIGGVQMTNESHNGYVEMYLNLGLVGLGLIALILGHGYQKTVRVFRRDSALGALLVAYVVTAATFAISEAGFRMLSVEWFFLLLPILAASRLMGDANGPSQPTRQFAEPRFVGAANWHPLLAAAGEQR